MGSINKEMRTNGYIDMECGKSVTMWYKAAPVSTG